jgi:hypothetical protein
MKTIDDMPAVHLDCLSRCSAKLRDVVTELEVVLGSADALPLASGAMRSISAIAKLQQQIVRKQGA